MEKLKVMVITGGGCMGYTARALQELEREGLVDIVVVTAGTRTPSTGWMNGLFGEQAKFAIMDELPNPKRQALLSQLQRAKMRRDKNMVRDLTRQLEKVS